MTRSYLGYVSSQTTDTIVATTGYGVATGGTGPTTITDGGFSWSLLTFNSDGTLTVTKAGLFDVFVVGGGGGSGRRQHGGEATGGGGGGMVFQNTLYLAEATYTVDVGAAGAGGAGGDYSIDAMGFESSIYNTAASPTTVIAAAGGGGGGNAWGGTVGQWAGNVGGASFRSGYGGQSATARGPLNYSGGSSNGSDTAGGGGGAGGAASSNTAGAGRTSTFSGTSTTYGIGGGGGNASGDGSQTAVANTGNGGKGLQNGGAASNGVAGQTGIVMVRFR